MATSGFPNRPFNLRSEVWLISQDWSANNSLIGWQLWIDKTGYSPTFSNDGQADRAFYFDGVQAAFNGTRGFDFTGGGPWLILSGQATIGHNADGTKTVATRGDAVYAILGGTSVASSLTLPTIPRNPPPAPLAQPLNQITLSSMRFQFNSRGDGGSQILRWDAQMALDANWAQGLTVPSDGTTVFTGLLSGRLYAARARGVNAAGEGAWSNVVQAYTLSGGYISDGATWKPAQVLISDGATWKPAQVLISDGATWKPTG